MSSEETQEPLIRVMALHALMYCERLFCLEEVETLRIAGEKKGATATNLRGQARLS